LPKVVSATEHEVGIDVSWFAQADGGGNPVQREGVRYLGTRVYADLQVAEAVRLRAAVTVAELEDGGSDDSADLERVPEAAVTEPSQRQTPVAATLYAEVRPPDTGLRITPGLSLFHQDDYRSFGVSLDASWELNGGDTVPFLGAQLLYDELELHYWDGSDRGQDHRWTVSLLGGVTQVLQRRLVGTVSVQYVHQQGFLGDPINVVPLYRRDEVRRLVDERLPRRRDRFQLNGRLRFALWRGWSVGLDASGYADTWGVDHGALEPNLELAPIRDVLIVRLWYRFSLQSGARHFEEQPDLRDDPEHLTRDSDLGSFASHGFGALVILRSPRALGGVFPELHANCFGYARDDGVDGLEVSGGLAVRF
jgi:hypothetical protein